MYRCRICGIEVSSIPEEWVRIANVGRRGGWSMWGVNGIVHDVHKVYTDKWFGAHARAHSEKPNSECPHCYPPAESTPAESTPEQIEIPETMPEPKVAETPQQEVQQEPEIKIEA